MGDYIFSYCKDLRKVTFGEGSRLRKIGRSAFSYCTSLRNIDLPAGLEDIGSKCFQESGLEEIVIPNGIVTI